MPQLLDIAGSDPHKRLVFYCPGCKCDHGVPIPPHSKAWSWNGSVDKPTLSPSILVTYNGLDAGKDDAPQAICHSFVKDGQIQFLSDCSHELAGKTVELT